MVKSPYLPNTDADRKAMLDAIGMESVEPLFCDFPEKLCNIPFKLPEPLSELELTRELSRISSRNAAGDGYASFLGAGYYRHFIPAVVHHLTGRSEFYTAYTPYQPEISQGTLQVIYEYQSFMCALTGMDVSNAGMYDGCSASAEAALMACRVTGRTRIAVITTVSPVYRDVIKTYAGGHDLTVETLEPGSGTLKSDAACLIVQNPDYFGYFEDMKGLSEKAHANGSLFIVITNPISLGLFAPPSEYGADIVVAEGQPLGNPPNFGGPGLGIFTCRKEYLRQMPGRLCGRTVDIEGKMGFVLTLATREQHIRRERATSNICTNEALVALTATVYLAAMGKEGLRRVAELCYHKAHYAAKEISGLKGYSMTLDKPFFNEFTVRCPVGPAGINEALLKKGIIGGLDVSEKVGNGMLLCVTELNTREEIDKLVKILRMF